MADKQKYEGFPKIFVKGEGAERATRAANTPTDAVNLSARGYSEDAEGTKDYQSALAKASEAKTDEAPAADSAKTDEQTDGADSASAVSGSAEAPTANTPEAKAKASNPRPPAAGQSNAAPRGN